MATRRKPRNIYRSQGGNHPVLPAILFPVQIIQANLTDTNELTIDIAGTVSTLPDAAQFRVVTVSVTTATPRDWFSGDAGGQVPIAFEVTTFNLAPGTCRLTLTYPEAINPDTDAICITPDAAAATQFVGGTIPPNTVAPIFIP
jgi:hypothetical protein